MVQTYAKTSINIQATRKNTDPFKYQGASHLHNKKKFGYGLENKEVR